MRQTRVPWRTASPAEVGACLIRSPTNRGKVESKTPEGVFTGFHRLSPVFTDFSFVWVLFVSVGFHGFSPVFTGFHRFRILPLDFPPQFVGLLLRNVFHGEHAFAVRRTSEVDFSTRKRGGAPRNPAPRDHFRGGLPNHEQIIC